MKRLMLAAVLLLAGCIQLSSEQQKAHAAPLAALPELVEAATAFRLSQGRWPQTKDELHAGFSHRKEGSRHLQRIQSVTIVDQSPRSILYRCRFADGGSTEVRINLNGETGPVRPPDRSDAESNATESTPAAPDDDVHSRS